jgi:hypothetical protein
VVLARIGVCYILARSVLVITSKTAVLLTEIGARYSFQSLVVVMSQYEAVLLANGGHLKIKPAILF